MRASDRAYQELRDQIVTWALPPGTALGEVEQATRLGISRTPLREALARLVADGLAAPQGGRGLVVTDVTAGTVEELYEARQGLEQQAARLAAQRRDPAVFTDLRAQFVTAPDLLGSPAGNQSEYFALTGRLDDAINEATRNPYLAQAIEGIRMHMVRIRRVAHDNTDRLLAAAQEHLLIVDAILDGDGDLAASATHVHLHASMLSVLNHVTDSSSSTGRRPGPAEAATA